MNPEPKKTEQQPSGRPSFRKALKTAPKRLWGIVCHNWGWKLLALFLAVCLWAGLITQDPTLTREHYFYDVPVTVSGAETLRRNGMIVLSGLDAETLTTRLRVDVPQREYNTVSAGYYNPRIDLSRITATGEQTLKILSTSTTTYGTVKSLTPDSVTVVVDEYITNYRVPVSVNLIGDYPAGFYGATPSLDPSAVAVSGPKSIVGKIARVYVDFDVSRLAAQAGLVRTALPMRFVDKDGNAVESDLLEVTSADVLLRTIIVEQQLYPTKTLSISGLALTEGIPAEGYELKGVTASPNTLLAAGEEAKLSALETLFIDDPVDITGRSDSFTVEVKLRKPSELVYLSTDTVTLHFEIQPILTTRTFENVKLTARGAADGQSWTLSQKSVSVAVTGPQLMLDGLKSANLSAYADLGGLPAGEHELPIRLLMEGANVSSMSYTVSPSTVTATITEE